ncbi:hypothetical protein [Kribbella sp.]|uniref:hypothetical protein n=1 Tax=Kribbella sp. TaxID=1871183 RepID=UPI002D583436|nr:hypothetical protein [Kribbella sp.]HZX08369.1 hypothetical protein [Kribbella sp.]
MTHRRHLGSACAAVAVAAILLTGCTKPTNLADIGTTTDTSADRIAKLHAAAQCIRSHGIQNFNDPVLGATGQVFTDYRSLQDAPAGGLQNALSGCRQQLRAATWNPETQPPAPAALIAAGVKAARCLRQNGLPAMKDPNARTTYVPGHGFGMNADELPPGANKQTAVVQQAFHACRTLLDVEIEASKLDKLAGQ